MQDNGHTLKRGSCASQQKNLRHCAAYCRLRKAHAGFVPGKYGGGPGEGPEEAGPSEGVLEAGGLGGGGLPPMNCPGGPGCGNPIIGGICIEFTEFFTNSGIVTNLPTALRPRDGRKHTLSIFVGRGTPAELNRGG